MNVAQSLNGYIAGISGRRVAISSEEDLERMHRIRAGVDGIIIGANTVINDDPKLLVDRKIVPDGRQPARIVLDRSLRIPAGSRVLDSSARTIIFTASEAVNLGNAEVFTRENEMLRIDNILMELQGLGMGKVLVEGGKDIIDQFLRAGVVDEFHVFIGDVILENGGLHLFSPNVEIRNIIRSSVVLGRGVLISLDPDPLQRIWRTQARDI